MPTNRPPVEATIRAAVAKSGADAVLLARISTFETKTELITVAPPIGIERALYGDPYMNAGMYGGPGMYGGWYDDTIAIDYQRATVYTTLFDVRTAKPVWTFDVPEFDPATVRQDMPRYIDTVVENLLKARLLRP